MLPAWALEKTPARPFWGSAGGSWWLGHDVACGPWSAVGQLEWSAGPCHPGLGSKNRLDEAPSPGAHPAPSLTGLVHLVGGGSAARSGVLQRAGWDDGDFT